METPAPKPFDVAVNLDLLIKPFWTEIQSVVEDQIAKKKLEPIGMGIYGCSAKEHAELKVAIDKALTGFGTKNL
jgi:hypothetical protein